MIKASEAYKAAISAESRRMLLKAVINIIDPDITYGTVGGSAADAYAKPAQLHDRNMDLTPYATLEHNRWLLDGSFKVLPDDPAELTDEVGYIGDAISDADGLFSPAVWVEETFDNVSILQACSIYFPNADFDGHPVDFTVEVMQGGTAYYTKIVAGNSAKSISLDGFTVHNPDAIRLTVTKWSLPHRRLRIAEIIPGVYEQWDNNIIAAFNIAQQVNFACLALPYGTCTLSMDNLDKRFEPRSKSGVFKSIEARQGIEIYMGVRLPDGSGEYIPAGVYYQYSGGWKTGDNGLSMQWDLVDIIGLLAEREFIMPDMLPVTLKGWAAALVAQLGDNFTDKYIVDPDYADTAMTATAAEIAGLSCGELLRYVCMAAGVFPRADATTGKLAIEPYWHEGNRLTLDNLTAYPVMRANDDLAAIIFTLHDGQNTQYVVSGNSTASSSTVAVDNPFIKSTAAALTAAKMILSTYGGNKLEVTGWGDPASELGDVDTVWLDESSATTGRRVSQSVNFSDGVIQSWPAVLLQADGSFLYEERETLTESGTWTAPAGVTSLRLILVGHGADSTAGTDGTWTEAGIDGEDGVGGKVWAGTVNINAGQTFAVAIGDNAVFGAYSSANGRVYQYGYTDIQSGDSFGRSGVVDPAPGSGDGGAAGKGGVKGNRRRETVKGEDGSTISQWVTDNRPGRGAPGKAGAGGCVVIYWDKEV